MMKKLPVFLLSLIILVACANETAQNNDAQGTGADSDTDTETETPDHEERPYLMVQMNQYGDPVFKVYYEYNEKGMVSKETIRDSSAAGVRMREKEYVYKDTLLQEMIMHDGQGGIEYTVNYTYNDQDQLIRQESMDTEIYNSVEYTYDEQGNVIEEKNYDINSGTTKLVFTYVMDTLLKTAHQYDPSGNLIKGNVYFYNEKGQKTDTKFIDARGDTTIHWTHIYDEEGRLIRDAEMGENDQSYIVKSYIFDRDGNLVLEEQTKYQFYKIDYLRDDDGRLHTEKTTGNNQVVNRIIYYE